MILYLLIFTFNINATATAAIILLTLCFPGKVPLFCHTFIIFEDFTNIFAKTLPEHDLYY